MTTKDGYPTLKKLEIIPLIPKLCRVIIATEKNKKFIGSRTIVISLLYFLPNY